MALILRAISVIAQANASGSYQEQDVLLHGLSVRGQVFNFITSVSYTLEVQEA